MANWERSQAERVSRMRAGDVVVVVVVAAVFVVVFGVGGEGDGVVVGFEKRGWSVLRRRPPTSERRAPEMKVR
jgi:hypothetical protein